MRNSLWDAHSVEILGKQLKKVSGKKPDIREWNLGERLRTGNINTAAFHTQLMENMYSSYILQCNSALQPLQDKVFFFAVAGCLKVF